MKIRVNINFRKKQVLVKYLEKILKVFITIASRGELPLHILKQSSFTYRSLADWRNDGLLRGIFPHSLKCANIMLIDKRDEANDKENYWSVSGTIIFKNL